MKTTERNKGAPSDLAKELQWALEDVARGIPAPKKYKQPANAWSGSARNNRRLFGEQKIAVELVRETRGEA